MRPKTFTWLFATLAVALASPACTTAARETSRPGAVTEAPARKAGMPRPYRLDREPALALHVQEPAATIDVLAAHVPDVLDARALVQQMLGDSPLDKAIAAHVDLARPWDAAWVENQLVAQLPIEKASIAAIKQLLAGKPPVGRFGAVDLGRGALAGPKLAWLDDATGLLTLADDERGLATGREIAPTYGKHPIMIEIDAVQAKKLAPAVTFTRLSIVGKGSDEITITADGVPTDRMPDALTNGALTGLLEADLIAAGASSRYAHHDRDVKNVMARGKREVDGLPFFVRGNAEDLLRRFGSVARSWNGRVMLGAGPQRHVLIGLGTDEPSKTAGAVYHLMSGVTSNLSLAKQFGASLPSLRWKKDKRTAAGNVVSVLALENAKKHVPAEYHPLIDGRGDLRLAIAFPSRTGAAMLVIGPECDQVLADWIEQTKGATPAADSKDDFMAASLALDAGTVRQLLSSSLDPKRALTLQASRAPTKVVVRRDGDRIEVAVRGPKLEVPPATATAARPTKPRPISRTGRPSAL